MHLQGNCGDAKETRYSRAPRQCVIDVRHKFLATSGAVGANLQLSNLYIRGARDAADGVEACLLDLPYARVWLRNVTLEGDSTRRRGICADVSTDIFAKGAPHLTPPLTPQRQTGYVLTHRDWLCKLRARPAPACRE